MLLGFTVYVKNDDYLQFWRYLQRRFGIPQNMSVLELLPEGKDTSVHHATTTIPKQKVPDDDENDDALVPGSSSLSSPYIEPNHQTYPPSSQI